MRANGAWTALVSGGFDVFTGRASRPCSAFTRTAPTACSSRTAGSTGLVAEPILGRAAKADALIEISARLGLTPADAIAVGDGANDLDMIRLAGTGVALHAKPAVAAEAKVRIDHGDLTALLYLQGYRRESSRHEADPHRTPDPAQLGRSRPRAVPPHQFRRARHGVLPVPPRPRRRPMP